MTGIEQELINVHHYDAEMSKKDIAKRTGRGGTPKISRRPLLRKGETSQGTCDDKARKIRYVAQRLSAIRQCAVTVSQQGDNPTYSNERVRRMIKRLDNHVPAFGDLNSPVVQIHQWCSMVRNKTDHRIDNCKQLDTVIKVWDSLLVKATNRLAATRRANYRAHVQKAISHKGAQGFHRMLKKRTEEMARPTERDPNTTADQAHADEQIDIWKEIWGISDFPENDHDFPNAILVRRATVSTN